eukprot:TRINITY_DN20670_c0_g1_i1.p1 TRINITY_DN20670_c0_g1~~TRINITY_DN20670_c0_g1_i1.p1  ORF type:complete len:505 (+),score=105.78 TRINITY_DN20670_c0_g1_i1:64-1578(+)
MMRWQPLDEKCNFRGVCQWLPRDEEEEVFGQTSLGEVIHELVHGHQYYDSNCWRSMPRSALRPSRTGVSAAASRFDDALPGQDAMGSISDSSCCSSSSSLSGCSRSSSSGWGHCSSRSSSRSGWGRSSCSSCSNSIGHDPRRRVMRRSFDKDSASSSISTRPSEDSSSSDSDDLATTLGWKSAPSSIRGSSSRSSCSPRDSSSWADFKIRSFVEKRMKAHPAAAVQCNTDSGESDGDGASDMSEEAHTSGTAGLPSHTCLQTAIQTSLEDGSLGNAQKLLEFACTAGLGEVFSSAWEELITAYCEVFDQATESSAAEECMESMLRHGVRPSRLCYEAVVSALIAAERTNAAQLWLGKMIEVGFQPELHLSGDLARLCCSQDPPQQPAKAARKGAQTVSVSISRSTSSAAPTSLGSLSTCDEASAAEDSSHSQQCSGRIRLQLDVLIPESSIAQASGLAKPLRTSPPSTKAATLKPHQTQRQQVASGKLVVEEWPYLAAAKRAKA